MVQTILHHLELLLQTHNQSGGSVIGWHIFFAFTMICSFMLGASLVACTSKPNKTHQHGYLERGEDQTKVKHPASGHLARTPPPTDR